MTALSAQDPRLRADAPLPLQPEIETTQLILQGPCSNDFYWSQCFTLKVFVSGLKMPPYDRAFR